MSLLSAIHQQQQRSVAGDRRDCLTQSVNYFHIHTYILHTHIHICAYHSVGMPVS